MPRRNQLVALIAPLTMLAGTLLACQKKSSSNKPATEPAQPRLAGAGGDDSTSFSGVTPDPPSSPKWKETKIPSDRVITATWESLGDPRVVGFEVQLFQDQKCNEPVGDPIKDLGPEVTSQSITLPEKPRTYRFQVAAIDAAGDTYKSDCSDGRKIEPPILSPGKSHVCALRTNGTVYCWGDNTYGQLGNGSYTASIAATKVIGLTSVTSITAGRDHSCALLDSGYVMCWGSDLYGQLGNGAENSVSSEQSGRTPQFVANLENVIAIDSGSDHSCAALADGTVRCWGRNSSGQLGTGDTSNPATAVEVTKLSGVVQVATGSSHTCALLKDGRVQCWGDNNYGQLGRGTAPNDFLIPAYVVGNSDEPLEDVVAIHAGDDFTCAVNQDGKAFCWGKGTNGQLGSDLTENSNYHPSAKRVALSGVATSLALGSNHACALLDDASVSCWGQGSNLGDVAVLWSNATPQAVPNLVGVTRLVAGMDHTFATFDEGYTYTWGPNNSTNQLGLEALDNPSRILSGASWAGTGSGHTCAVIENTLQCWGNNQSGQLGDNSRTTKFLPVTITPSIAGSLTSVAVGSDHSCAVIEGGLQCWGENSSGQLGNGSNTDSLIPVTVFAAGSGVTQVALGSSSHGCAIVSGSLRCWGSNYFGQLGNASTTSSNIPLPVTDLSTDVTDVAIGSYFTCAVVSGSVKCWGYRGNYLLANSTITGDVLTPQAVSLADGANPTSIAAGSNHICAVANGGVQCWGRNENGPTGDTMIQKGFSRSWSYTRTAKWVPGLPAGSGVTKVVAGSNHTCALLDTGNVTCWGSGIAVGYGSLTDLNTPTTVSGITKAQNIFASSGSNHTCAILSTGELRCWGNNDYGQLAQVSKPLEMNN